VKRKYLDDLGVKKRWDQINDEREKRWKKQRETYGFDDRETWNLDSAFYEWLYERLMMYKEIGGKIVNLDSGKFEYGGKIYSQAELIDEMLKRLEFNFSDKYNDWEEDQYKYVHEIEKMWAVVLPAMWW